MKSQYLNSTLFTLIGAHLTTNDLAQLSLTSRTILSFVQPLLYKHYEIGYEAPKELSKRQRNNVKKYLRNLGEDKKRCLLIKKFTAWNDPAWGGTTELDLLLRVVQQTTYLEEFHLIHISGPVNWNPESSSGNDWSKVWATLQDREQLRTLVGTPWTSLAWNFEKFRRLKSLILEDGRVQPEVDGSLPASLLHLSLDRIARFDENWIQWRNLSNLESLILIDIRKEDFKTIYTAFQRCRLDPSNFSLTTIRLDVCALEPGRSHPDEDDLVSFLQVFAKSKSIKTVRISSVPESLGKVTMLPDFSSRPEEPHEQADGKLAKALSEFHDLEHLTLVFGYRPDEGIPAFWRQFSGRHLDRFINYLNSLAKLKSLETNVYCLNEEPLDDMKKYEDLRTTEPHADDLDEFARMLFKRLPSIEVLKFALHGKGRKYRRGFEKLEPSKAKRVKRVIHLKI